MENLIIKDYKYSSLIQRWIFCRILTLLKYLPLGQQYHLKAICALGVERTRPHQQAGLVWEPVPWAGWHQTETARPQPLPVCKLANKKYQSPALPSCLELVLFPSLHKAIHLSSAVLWWARHLSVALLLASCLPPLDPSSCVRRVEDRQGLSTCVSAWQSSFYTKHASYKTSLLPLRKWKSVPPENISLWISEEKDVWCSGT